MEHAKGPWSVEKYEMHPHYEIYARGMQRVAFCEDHLSESEGNARLISAAPDLLEEHERWAKVFGEILVLALQEDFNLVKWIANNMKIDYENGSPVLHSSAIQKAKGE